MEQLKGRRIDRVTGEIEDQTRPPQRPPRRLRILSTPPTVRCAIRTANPRHAAVPWRLEDEGARRGCGARLHHLGCAERGHQPRPCSQGAPTDEEFAVGLADALELSEDKLEAEAVRRAKSGSDLLLIFLLRHIRPFKFNIEHYHKLGPIQMDEQQIATVTSAISSAMTESDMSARQQQVFRDALESHLQAHEAHS